LSKSAAGDPAKFSRRGVEFLGVITTARLECDEPATKASELIRREPGNSFGDFFNFHVTQYSTAEIWQGPLLGQTGYSFSTYIRDLPFDFAVINWGFVALYLICRLWPNFGSVRSTMWLSVVAMLAVKAIEREALTFGFWYVHFKRIIREVLQQQ
jgi:hypothetical protein